MKKICGCSTEAKKKAFVVYIATLKIQEGDVYPTKKAKIVIFFCKRGLSKSTR